MDMQWKGTNLIWGYAGVFESDLGVSKNQKFEYR